ncbi:MAG: hypothetical protein ACFE88_10015 [Candidatus Hermodarchaeota archaeon]
MLILGEQDDCIDKRPGWSGGGVRGELLGDLFNLLFSIAQVCGVERVSTTCYLFKSLQIGNSVIPSCFLHDIFL